MANLCVLYVSPSAARHLRYWWWWRISTDQASVQGSGEQSYSMGWRYRETGEPWRKCTGLHQETWKKWKYCQKCYRCGGEKEQSQGEKDDIVDQNRLKIQVYSNSCGHASWEVDRNGLCIFEGNRRRM